MLLHGLVTLMIFAASGPPREVTALGSLEECSCAVFKHPSPRTTTDTPMSPMATKFDFLCDPDGKKSCLKMCKALSGTVQPGNICELLENTDGPFKPMIYFKACDDKIWTQTNKNPIMEVCCKDKEVIPCT